MPRGGYSRAYLLDDYRQHSSFRAYQNANQTYVNASGTVKLNLQSKTPTSGTSGDAWDNLGEFDQLTNYRFTPKAEGMYQFVGSVYWQAPATGRIVAYFYRTGLFYARFPEGAGSGNDFVNVGTTIIPLTPTDYVEVFIFYSGTGSPVLLNGPGNTYFAGWRIG